jgi:hypothetical protein
VIPEPVVPSDDGLSLRPWRGEPLTVGEELNKLAFNMAFGRDTAGVHFRRDEIERDRARRVIWIPLQRARGPVPASG